MADPKFDQIKGVLATLGLTFGGCVIMDPTVATRMREQGYDTMQKLVEALWKGPNDGAPHFRRVQDIHIIVTGGSTNAYWQYGGMRYEKTLSVDKWR